MTRKQPRQRTKAATASGTHWPAEGGSRPRSSQRAGVHAGRGLPAPARIAAFLLLAAVAVGGAALLWPRVNVPAGTEAARTVQISMGGFSEPLLTAHAGEALRLRLVNPDSSFHTDGGGWHQLAIPALGVDARVAPRSMSLVEIPGAPPGEYTFYCDVCCGGKENPTMQGTLRVVA